MRGNIKAVALLLSALGILGGCGGGMDDLRTYIDDVKKRPGGRIDPLPQIQPYERFVYEAAALREPFTPYRPSNADGSGGVRPDPNRRREYLERYPLDTLEMVGTISRLGRDFGLLQDPDGLIHQVEVGNHIGQNDGRIVQINQSEISLIEIVSDGMGGFLERPAAVALSE